MILSAPKRLAMAALLALGLASAAAASPKILGPAEVKSWRDDLRHLAVELPRRHKDLFRRTPRAEFELAVRSLDARLPELARHEAVVALARIVALAPDGHTAIQGLLYESPARFRYLPIGLYLFRDGLHVYAADPRYKALVGGRVVRIGRSDARRAIDAVAPLIPRDNDMAIRERAPLYLTCPEILHALRIAADMERVPITIEKDGRRITLELAPATGPRPSRDNWALGQRFSVLDGWIDARSGSRAPTPSWLKAPADYFRSEWLDDERTLYAQYNEVADKPGESVADWVARLRETMRTRPVDRFVLDLRWNTGGNNYLNKPLLLTLIKAESVNRPGGLYAIIGRRNFSAVQNLVNDLDNYTEVIFVGEPTAGNPNFFGDPTSIVLPNSGLVIRASTLWWQDVDPRDRRPWTSPDLAVEPAFADYRDNRDPALELVLRHRPERPLAERMFEAFATGDAPAALALYESFRRAPINAYADTEGAMNGLGYRLLGLRRFADAIAVFGLNAKAYPGSPNAHDSLAEAYAESGDRARAIEHYRKVLELDPGNANATERLRSLETAK